MFTGGFEFIFVLFIAFLLFGPKKLPEIARVLGKGLGELRRASNELKFSLEEEIRNLDRDKDHNATDANALPPYTYAHQDKVLEAHNTLEAEPQQVDGELAASTGDLTGTVTNNGHDHREAALREPESHS
ncbi:MAG TPA: twin-arginine translocase TatA/TatE family subunit [Terriglobia bacterium]|nr:twin-arginine translocase TatA/TatE family subunit [Terriglobia bacterium]